MSAPWDQPHEIPKNGYDQFIGRPVITIVGGVRRNVPSQYGLQDIPHVTLVSLVGPDAGGIYNDIIVFTSRIRKQLAKEDAGYVTLSKVVDAGKAPELQPYDNWDNEAATAWYRANPGLLDQLKAGAVQDFQAWLANNRGNGGQPQQPVAQYAQPQYQPQAAAQPQYGQPAQPYQPQPAAQPYAPPQYAQPLSAAAPTPYPTQYGPSTPEHQQGLRDVGGPPATPPPTTYNPQGATSPTMGSMGAPPPQVPVQPDEPPF